MYIVGNSAHNRLSAFIRGEGERLICNSSSERVAFEATSHFVHRLLARGYSLHDIVTELCQVSYSKVRLYLQLEKAPYTGTPPVKLALVIPHIEQITSLGLRKIARLFPFEDDYEFKPVLSYKNQPSLHQLLHQNN